MTAEPTPAPPDSLHRELTQERLQSARRMNLLRFVVVSVFFALCDLASPRLEKPFDPQGLRSFVRALV